MHISTIVHVLLLFSSLMVSKSFAQPPSRTLDDTVLGMTLLTPRVETAPIEEEQKLSTRPLGRHVFKTVVEVENVDQLEPGVNVDVHLVTLTDEGAKTHRILRRIRVYSIAQWQPQPPSMAVLPAQGSPDNAEPEEAAIDDAQDSIIIPVRAVGFIVNSSQLETMRLADAQGVIRLRISETKVTGGVLRQIWHNLASNLFQPLLLFFFMGFAVPLLKVPLDFPKPLYQILTIYLLIAIGWHGGELMAQQSSAELRVAGGLVVIGLLTNGMIGILATKFLQWFTPMRKIDTVTVGAYYGSDSAGTFVTCLGILATLGILHDSYMPVMLATMEIPGCLVGLYFVSKLRQRNMDSEGNMPDEKDYSGVPIPSLRSVGAMAVNKTGIDWKVLHEVFLNPGLYMLFGGIVVGFISGIQALADPHVVEGPDHLFIFMFKGALCLFLLEMGMTACRRLSDLKTAGWGFIAFGLLSPNVFACIGMLVIHAYSMAIGHSFYLGTYALFAVLCGAASYIAVPAVQRLAIPEASPTLPLAASLGLTFTWNVTLGIPIYIEVAKAITATFPV